MSDADIFHIKENMDVNGDGSTVVTCPECENEITIVYSNIADDSMALVDCIKCPACNSNLDQVHPSQALNKKIADHVAKILLKDLHKEFGKSFTKK